MKIIKEKIMEKTYWVMKPAKLVLIIILISCFGISVKSFPHNVNKTGEIPG